jgi:hypothetical protein
MRKFCIMGAAFVASFFFNINAALAALNLPGVPVTVHVTGGDDSFFDFTLSNVPGGFDVGNGTYRAWCHNLFNTNDPTINGGIHQGVLVSSLSPSLPPPLSSIPWDKINYIINHKQGEIIDIQYAIWHFTEGFNPDPNVNPIAIDLIEEADANGSGFVPGPGDVTAVVVIWIGADANVQGCFIEVPPPQECQDRFTSGGFIFVNGKKATFGIQGGMQNGRLWGGVNYKDHGTGMHVHGRTVTSYTVISENCREATYEVKIDGEPGTATVRVCDNGEPGVDDTLEITLSNGYTAGAGTTLGGDGPGGGNVQLHKPKCDKGKPAKAKSGGKKSPPFKKPVK